MKKFFLLSVFISNFLFLTAQEIELHSKVDERQELLSIVFGLAGLQEYNSTVNLKYYQDVKKYFFSFKNHKVVKYAHFLGKYNGIRFNRISSFVYHIEIKNDTILFRDSVMENSLSDWNKKRADKFLVYLNDFYKTTSFNKFYKEHKAYYSITEARFDTLLKHIDFKWFRNFYGSENSDSFNVIISLLNGRNNYGAIVSLGNNKTERYAVIGTSQSDNIGMPIYSNEYKDILIHEFCHTFCNPLIDKNFEKLEQPASIIFKTLSKDIKKNQYNNTKTMLYETLVRASVIRYAYCNLGKKKSQQLMCQDKFRGFIFIDKVANILEIYENNKINYPSIDSFVPQIIKLFDTLNIEVVKNEYNNNCANIIKTSIDDCQDNVDFTLTNIKIFFDKPMNANIIKCITLIKKDKTKTTEFNTISWDSINKNVCILNLELKSDAEYRIIFSGYYFMTETFFPLCQNYELSFKTQKQ